MNSMIRTAPAHLAPLRFAVVAAAHVLAAFVIAGALNLPKILDEVHTTLVPVPSAPTTPRPAGPAHPNGAEPVERVHPEDPPPPDVRIEDTDTGIEGTPVEGPFSGQGGAAADVPTRVDVRVDPAHPLTQPDYPPASIRLQEQGVVVLELRVGADGRVLEARVVSSSGHPRLDAAAVREALQHWRLLPANENGQSVVGTLRERVNFRLQDAG